MGFIVFPFCHFYFLTKIGTPLFVAVFFLTELRDLFSFWIGKLVQKLSQKMSRKSFFAILLNGKIAEKFSPHKTWFVGVVSALLMAVIAMQMTMIFNENQNQFNLGMDQGFVIGLLVGIAGLFGDLLFSFLKRMYNVKDSGSLLPGGEGVLDRFDALLISIPVVYLYITNFS